MYIIKRDDGMYVARSGSHSYTKRLEGAKTFPSREAAERDLCPENESIVAVDSLLSR